MSRHIPFYPELLDEGASTNEVLLYGLIEATAFSEGFCYASSKYMASQLGVVIGTIKNLLTKLSKRGWVAVEIDGNKRIAITPLLGLSVKKDRHSTMTLCGKTCAKACEKPVQKNADRHSTMTVPSFYDDARIEKKTGVLINNIINNNSSSSDKKEAKSTNTSAGFAGSEPAGGLPKRKDFESTEDYENAIYAARTMLVS